MKKTLIKSLFFIGYMLTNLDIAHATNITSNFSANATLNAICTLNAENLSFGNIQAVGSTATITTTSNINVFCSRSATYSLNLSLGNSWVDPRRNMTSSSGDKIAYLLTAYNDSGANGTWGYSYTVYGVGTAAINTHKVYGWLDLGQFQTKPVKPGTFSDDVVATVTF